MNILYLKNKLINYPKTFEGFHKNQKFKLFLLKFSFYKTIPKFPPDLLNSLNYALHYFYLFTSKKNTFKLGFSTFLNFKNNFLLIDFKIHHDIFNIRTLFKLYFHIFLIQRSLLLEGMEIFFFQSIKKKQDLTFLFLFCFQHILFVRRNQVDFLIC